MAKREKAPEQGLSGADQYMRYTDKDGATHVEHHRVVAGGRFAQSQADEYAKLGGKAKAEPISREQYLAERKPRG